MLPYKIKFKFVTQQDTNCVSKIKFVTIQNEIKFVSHKIRTA